MTGKILLATIFVEILLVIVYQQKDLRKLKRSISLKNIFIVDFVIRKIMNEIFLMLRTLAGDDSNFNCQITSWQEGCNSIMHEDMDIIAIIMYLVVMSDYEKIKSMTDVKILIDNTREFVHSLKFKNREDYCNLLDEFMKIINDARDIRTREIGI